MKDIHQQQVKDWMQKFGQECPEKPINPSLEVRRLRAQLILEEAIETIEALGFYVNEDSEVVDGTWECDLLSVADGCADLEFVTKGTLVACGIDGSGVFEEVCRSNNSKLWTNTDILQNSILSLPQLMMSNKVIIGQAQNTLTLAKVIPSIEQPDAPARWLCKNVDGKIIKSPSYSPATIAPILEKQTI